MLEKLPEAVGHLLRHTRAGLEKIALNQGGLRAGLRLIEVSSLAFGDHMPIPQRYTADGEGISPPLAWKGVPQGTASLVLIVEDADSPTPQPLVHAIAVDLPAGGEGALPEGALRSAGHDGHSGLHEGRNSYFMAGWLAPDPPPGHGSHRYVFQLFALGPGAAFTGKPGRDELLDALRERGLAGGCLTGTYARPDGSIDSAQPAPALPLRT